MQPAARSFYRTAILAMSHAAKHSAISDESDAIQVVLSLDYGIEMLLKATLLNRGESIMAKPGRTISLPDALKECGHYDNSSSVEILRQHRDNLQHFAGYASSEDCRDLMEGIMLFTEEVHTKEFSMNLPKELSAMTVPSPPKKSENLKPIHESPQLQRDVSGNEAGEVIVWSQAEPNSEALGIYYSANDGQAIKLTPIGQFEYMPRTDGRYVVAYRQGGGVILYDIEKNARTVISETGAPTAVSGGYIGAQGLSIQEGLGGGVWLYEMSSGTWEQLSQSGDSVRISSDYLVWQEYDQKVGTQIIKYRKIKGKEVKSLANVAAAPSPSGRLIAYQDWGPESKIHVINTDGNEIYTAENGFFPSLSGKYLSYYRGGNEKYSLLVDNIETGQNLLELNWVGWPMGGTASIGEKAVYFESRSGKDVHAIWKAVL